MKIFIEHNVGETRAVVIDGDCVVEAHVERWSARLRDAQRGDVYRARVKTVDKSLNGAFCDLGLVTPGFLPFGKSGRPSHCYEGAALGVQVQREAFQNKGPTLSYLNVEPGNAPACISKVANLADRLAKYFHTDIIAVQDTEIDFDQIFDGALDPIVPLSCGGRIIIEPTTAMTVIDVDSHTQRSNSDNRRSAMNINIDAAKEAASQLRLRGIGGLVAIDFLTIKNRADRNNLEKTLKSAFKDDPAKIDIAPLSRFCTIELSRQRLRQSLYEQTVSSCQVLSTETRALNALRELEREARISRSTNFVITADDRVDQWLRTDTIGWHHYLSKHYGNRFYLQGSANIPVANRCTFQI